jgi:hypothetical protein
VWADWVPGELWGLGTWRLLQMGWRPQAPWEEGGWGCGTTDLAPGHRAPFWPFPGQARGSPPQCMDTQTLVPDRDTAVSPCTPFLPAESGATKVSTTLGCPPSRPAMCVGVQESHLA